MTDGQVLNRILEMGVESLDPEHAEKLEDVIEVLRFTRVGSLKRQFLDNKKHAHYCDIAKKLLFGETVEFDKGMDGEPDFLYALRALIAKCDNNKDAPE